MVMGVVLNLLTKLAAFSIKKPKTILVIVMIAAIGIFLAHYKMIIGERNKLEIANTAYAAAVERFEAREATLQADLILAQNAASQALQDRRAAYERLEAFRRGREADDEAQVWAAQPLPAGEITRLCAALPRMAGCN